MAARATSTATPDGRDSRGPNAPANDVKATKLKLQRFAIAACSATICIAVVLMLFRGCGEASIMDSNAWTKAIEVGKSTDSLSTSLSLYRWNNSLLAVGGDSGTFATRILAGDGKSWKTVSTVDPGWIPMDADPNENRFVRSRATLSSDSLDVRFAIGSLSPDGLFATRTTAPLHLDQAKLFPTAIPNLKMLQFKQPVEVGFVRGTMKGAEIRVPYYIEGIPIEGNTIRADRALSANGVFASSDGGRTWRTEAISTRYSKGAVVCRTSGFYYYFASANPGPPRALWYSRRPVHGGDWESGNEFDKKLASNLSVPNLNAIAEKDIVHLCWLDARHEKTSLSASRPRAENYEVAYAHRKDSDAGWSKDVVLSRGLKFAYAPSMSVEGNNVVVAWAGAKSGTDGRKESNPSDIYYVASKDGGETWTAVMQVTDGFTKGMTSGRPQVALHQGTIHLFYVQGTLNFKVSGGMALLNQPPWPVLYQQRPFPN